MNTTELLGIFRQEVSDFELPYLWSDALIYGYIDEAQKQFCRDTYGIEDARSYRLNIAADLEWYTLSPDILKVRRAVDRQTGRSVSLVAFEKAPQHGVRFDGRKGTLQALVTGMEKGRVRTYPVPVEASIVELHVFRLPYDVLAGDDFEVDPQHVRNLLYWVKYRAYNVHDAETSDLARAERNLALWQQYCARARDEQSRAMHPASTVVYGGL